jgi:hypothetical protein
MSCFYIDLFFNFNILKIIFIICLNLLFIKLSQSFNFDRGFDKLTRIIFLFTFYDVILIS